jgi:hypothetical protein
MTAVYSTTEEVSTRLQTAEEGFDLLQYKVDGWCVWPLLRFAMARALQRLPQDSMPSLSRAQRLRLAVRDLGRIGSISPVDVLAISHASNRSEAIDGFYKDIFFDEFLAALPASFKLEHADVPQFLPRADQAVIPYDLTFTLIDTLAGQLVKRFRLPEVDLVADRMKEGLKAAFGPDAIAETVVRELCRDFYWRKRMYVRLLRRIRPRVVVLVTGYSDHSFQAAAKETGATVVELQHGFLSRHHFGYSWSRHARRYKAAMPIPDRVMLYGDYWKSELMYHGFWQEELRSVGSFRVDQYRDRAKANSDVPSLVVTSQGVDTSRLVAFLTEFAALGSSRGPFRIVVKLHMREPSKAPYARLKTACPNAEILMSTEGPSTLELLADASCHASIYSTCHYESIALGTPTVVLPLTGHDYVEQLWRDGHARFVNSPRALADFFFDSSRHRLSSEVSEYYFRRDPLEQLLLETSIRSFAQVLPSETHAVIGR